MKTNRALSIIAALMAAAALLWLVGGSLSADDTIMSQAAPKEFVGWLIARKLQVQKGGASFDSEVTMSDDLTVSGATNLGAITTTSGTVSGDMTVGGLTLPSFVNAVITDGDTITPAYTTYALDTTGDVTITLAAVGTEGQELRLVADDANTIIINDTNIRAPGGGTITMTQYYVVGWLYQDSEWLMQYRSTNQ